MVEQQVPGGDDALQDADGVDDGGDSDPGNRAHGAGGLVVAVLVDSRLVLVAADQVPSGPAVRTGSGIGAASSAQAKNYW